ncbi:MULTISPECIES: hypothetical protein [unclassified Cryobacterium]|nr:MULTISPECIES: hypothetical protein [unclassified Cryobacterium]
MTDVIQFSQAALPLRSGFYRQHRAKDWDIGFIGGVDYEGGDIS